MKRVLVEPEPCSVVWSIACTAPPEMDGAAADAKCYRCGQAVCRACSEVLLGHVPAGWRLIRVCFTCVTSGTERLRPRSDVGACAKRPRPFVHLFVRHKNHLTGAVDAYFSCRVCGVVRADNPRARRGCGGPVAIELRSVVRASRGAP